MAYKEPGKLVGKTVADLSTIKGDSPPNFDAPATAQPVGTRLVSKGENATSQGVNRAYYALAENDEFLRSLVLKNIAVPAEKSVLAADAGWQAGRTELQLVVADGVIYAGPNAVGLKTVINVLDAEDEEVLDAAGNKVTVTKIRTKPSGSGGVEITYGTAMEVIAATAVSSNTKYSVTASLVDFGAKNVIAGMRAVISGATQAGNNGTYAITKVSGTTIDLAKTDGEPLELVENGGGNVQIVTDGSFFHGDYASATQKGPTIEFSAAVPNVDIKLLYGKLARLGEMPADAIIAVKIRGGEEVSADVEKEFKDVKGLLVSDDWKVDPNTSLKSLEDLTLDKAYDKGGNKTGATAGSGRAVTVDAGAVELTGSTESMGDTASGGSATAGFRSALRVKNEVNGELNLLELVNSLTGAETGDLARRALLVRSLWEDSDADLQGVTVTTTADNAGFVLSKAGTQAKLRKFARNAAYVLMEVTAGANAGIYALRDNHTDANAVTFTTVFGETFTLTADATPRAVKFYAPVFEVGKVGLNRSSVIRVVDPAVSAANTPYDAVVVVLGDNVSPLRVGKAADGDSNEKRSLEITKDGKTVFGYGSASGTPNTADFVVAPTMEAAASASFVDPVVAITNIRRTQADDLHSRPMVELDAWRVYAQNRKPLILARTPDHFNEAGTFGGVLGTFDVYVHIADGTKVQYNPDSALEEAVSIAGGGSLVSFTRVGVDVTEAGFGGTTDWKRWPADYRLLEVYGTGKPDVDGVYRPTLPAAGANVPVGKVGGTTYVFPAGSFIGKARFLAKVCSLRGYTANSNPSLVGLAVPYPGASGAEDARYANLRGLQVQVVSPQHDGAAIHVKTQTASGVTDADVAAVHIVDKGSDGKAIQVEVDNGVQAVRLVGGASQTDDVLKVEANAAGASAHGVRVTGGTTQVAPLIKVEPNGPQRGVEVKSGLSQGTKPLLYLETGSDGAAKGVLEVSAPFGSTHVPIKVLNGGSTRIELGTAAFDAVGDENRHVAFGVGSDPSLVGQGFLGSSRRAVALVRKDTPTAVYFRTQNGQGAGADQGKQEDSTDGGKPVTEVGDLRLLGQTGGKKVKIGIPLPLGHSAAASPNWTKTDPFLKWGTTDTAGAATLHLEITPKQYRKLDSVTVRLNLANAGGTAWPVLEVLEYNPLGAGTGTVLAGTASPAFNGALTEVDLVFTLTTPQQYDTAKRYIAKVTSRADGLAGAQQIRAAFYVERLFEID